MTRSSTARSSSAVSGAPWVKSKRSLSGPDVGAGLAHVRRRAPPAAPRAAGASPCGCTPSAAALGPDARDDALAARPARRRRTQHLVVAEPDDAGHRAHARPRPIAGVGDLAAALRVEGRLGELDEAVLRPPTTSVALLERLVAGERRSARAAPANAPRRSRRSSRAAAAGAARAPARAARSMSSSKPCASVPRPCSAAISTVSSNGKP